METASIAIETDLLLDLQTTLLYPGSHPPRCPATSAQPDAQSDSTAGIDLPAPVPTGAKRLRGANRLAIIAKASRLVCRNRRGTYRESHLEMVCALSGW